MSTVQQAVVFGFDVDAEAFKKKVEALGDKLAPKMEALGKRIGTKLRNTFEGVQNLITSMFKKIAIASAAAGAAIGVWTTMMGRSFIETARFAKAIGVSTQEMRTMQSAARIAGADVESLNQSFRMFREKLGEAQSLGTGEAIEALDGLKLRVEDLQNASLPEVFDIINQRIATLGLNSAQARDYVEKLGIEYDTFSAIVSNGALQEAQEIMAKFGIITAEQEDTFIRVSQKVNAFWEVIRNLGLEIAEGLMPMFDIMSDMLASQLPDDFSTVSTAVGNFSADAIDYVGEIIYKIMELVSAVRQAAASIKEVFSGVANFMAAVNEGRWRDVAGMIGNQFEFTGGGLAGAMGYGPTPTDGTKLTPAQQIAQEDRKFRDEFLAGMMGTANDIRDRVGAAAAAGGGGGGGTAPDRGYTPPALTPTGFTNARSSGGGSGGGGAASAAREAEKAERDRIKAIKDRAEAIEEAWATEHPYWAELLDIQKDMQVSAADTVQVWKNQFDSIGSAISDFVTKGKLDFESLFSSMAESFINHAIQMAMYGTAGGGGGIFGSILGALGVQGPNTAAAVVTPSWDGNVFRTPQKFFANGGLATMAEKGAEAILPLQRNARGQLGVVSGGGGGGSETFAPTININMESSGNSQEDAERMGKYLNKVMEQKYMEMRGKEKRSRLTRGY